MGKPFYTELLQLQETIKWAAGQDVEGLRTFFFSNLQKPLYCVGSGGAYSACRFVSILYRKFCGFATSLTPMELLEEQIAVKHMCKLLFISAGGKNKDILNAYKSAPVYRNDICNLSMRLCNPLASIAEERGSQSYNYDLPTKKDGFLATNSLVSFFVIISKAFYGEFEMDGLLSSLRDVENHAYSIKSQYNLDRIKYFTVLYSEQGDPVAHDIESKLSEAALGAVQLSDYRNFGHGRHHWFAKHTNESCVVAIFSDKTRALAEKTINSMPADIPVINICSKLENSLATVDLLIKSFYMVHDLGKIRGIDPGRPGVPNYGSKLYNLNYISLFHLPSHKESIKNISIARKCYVNNICQVSSSVVDFYGDCYCDYIKRLNTTTFSMIAFDYDGTLCKTTEKERYSECLEKDVLSALNNLLDHNIRIAIVTGRGKSVVDVLKNSIDKSYHSKITIGLYNGMCFFNLSECDSTKYEKTLAEIKESPLNEEIATLKEHLTKISPPYEIKFKCRRDMMAIITKYTSEVYNICSEIIKKFKLSNLNLWLSSHSIDVVINTVSKKNIHTNNNENILFIGDYGNSTGNDFEMLSTKYSLSCDKVSTLPDSCWNIAPQNAKGTDAAVYYIKNLKLADGTFKCKFKI